MQSRATKLIPGVGDLSYEEILKECGRTTPETRRLRRGGGQIAVFNRLNVHANIDPNIFFKIETCKITSGHDVAPVKELSRLDFRQYSFSQRTIDDTYQQLARAWLRNNSLWCR